MSPLLARLMLPAALLACACSDRDKPAAGGDVVLPPPRSATSSATGPSAPASASASAEIDMKGYPWARLPAVEPLQLELDDKELKALGVRSSRALSTTEGVRLSLLVLEFGSQKELLAARDKVLAMFTGAKERGPYYVDAAETGAWLLVVGFPGSKPVSPQMDEAKKAVLQRWAGEE